MPEQILAINGSTEPAVLAGMDIAMIPGDEHNYKITTQADLERFCKEKGDGSGSEQLLK
jgi:2-C-methyl-D-erythritol 4-phosphate cytidylyltransferase